MTADPTGDELRASGEHPSEHRDAPEGRTVPELVDGPPDPALPTPRPQARGVVRTSEPRRYKPKDVVRAALAITMSVLLLVLVGTGCWGWLHGGMDGAQMQDFMLFAQTFVTPASVVLVFYFTRRK